ncbi:hypothetical protein HNQ60_000107 [Povalibacter uvarum]|uniref:Uncharacterized protein n=1 Tax=Povalibacter uvarum TaxID=732238 RepID=A0A841HDT5_9GAMM|nr:hypothetical protein [Povalibacter uvarum]MBB6091261.1 hypothetical protein [Povalibacter uvarum]
MSGTLSIPLWVAFLVLCPVLDISGHFVYLPEACLYLMAGYRLLVRFPEAAWTDAERYRRRIRNAHIAYAALFAGAAALTAFLAEQSVNNYDVFMFRNILQALCCVWLLGGRLRSIESAAAETIVFRTILVLSVPALVVYLQAFDLFSMRSLVVSLYKPQFFFLGALDFAGFRYTSVFKDFFTAAVYFTLLSAFVFHFFLRTQLGMAHRACLLILLVMIYGAQLFVARTSLIMTPMMLAAIALFAAPRGTGVVLKRLMPAGAVAGVLAVIALGWLMSSGLVNASWAKEGLIVFSPDRADQSSSLSVMQSWHEQMFRQAFGGEFSLLAPRHAYLLTEVSDPGVYTDSFYGQELYRYGIYGAIAYIAYVLLMLRASLPVSRMVAIVVIALVIMNYKGGNTFFMPKTLYMYALILAFVPLIELRGRR